jgi:hypothetical protein
MTLDGARPKPAPQILELTLGARLLRPDCDAQRIRVLLHDRFFPRFSEWRLSDVSRPGPRIISNLEVVSTRLSPPVHFPLSGDLVGKPAPAVRARRSGTCQASSAATCGAILSRGAEI